MTSKIEKNMLGKFWILMLLKEVKIMTQKMSGFLGQQKKCTDKVTILLLLCSSFSIRKNLFHFLSFMCVGCCISETRHVASMILSVRPMFIIIFKRRLFCFALFWRTEGNMCENNDHYTGRDCGSMYCSKWNSQFLLPEDHKHFHYCYF